MNHDARFILLTLIRRI